MTAMMNDSHDERLNLLQQALNDDEDVCGSDGTLCRFPEMLLSPYWMPGVGFVVCEKGCFYFTVNGHSFVAKAGETVFIPSHSTFQIIKWSEGFAYQLLFYHIAPIREMLGSSVLAMQIRNTLSPGICDVWATGEEQTLCHYVKLMGCYPKQFHNAYEDHEQKLLLMALTYKLCAIFSRRLAQSEVEIGHRQEIFFHLLQLVRQYYGSERSVSFYADKLCLSPKYLSSLTKEIAGKTVQEIIFQAVVKRSIFLMKNSNKTIQQIADELNFPNLSAFGTFFKKQTGFSPRNYRTKE